MTTRQLRIRLADTLRRVASGEEVVVTRRGVPHVRLVPATRRASISPREPLRGSVLWMADDFDAPLVW